MPNFFQPHQAIREIKSEATLRSHVAPVRMLVIKETKNAGSDRTKEDFHTLLVGTKASPLFV